MPFAYFARLSAADKRTYEKSDAARSVRLTDPAAFRPLAGAIEAALATEKQRNVQRAADELVRALTTSLRVEPVVVTVHRQRPRNDWGELHGYYTRGPGREPHIEVWMRTAANARIVAFRTFLRTLLHELCHHLDFTLLHLEETFHTEGFLRRESSLVRQLVGATTRAPVSHAQRERIATPARKAPPAQLDLFHE